MLDCITAIWTDVHEHRRDWYTLNLGEYAYRFHVTKFSRQAIEAIVRATTPPTLEDAVALRRFMYDLTRPRRRRTYIDRGGITERPTLFGTEYAPKDVAFPPHIYDNVQRFRNITEQMASTYERKNADYGNSFGESITEFGAVAGIVRIGDKFNRLKNLVRNPESQRVNDESIADTLLDMANYCIMLKLELDNKQNNKHQQQ